MNFEIGTEAAQFPEKEIHKWGFRCSVRSLEIYFATPTMAQCDGRCMMRTGPSITTRELYCPTAKWRPNTTSEAVHHVPRSLSTSPHHSPSLLASSFHLSQVKYSVIKRIESWTGSKYFPRGILNLVFPSFLTSFRDVETMAALKAGYWDLASRWPFAVRSSFPPIGRHLLVRGLIGLGGSCFCRYLSQICFVHSDTLSLRKILVSSRL